MVYLVQKAETTTTKETKMLTREKMVNVTTFSAIKYDGTEDLTVWWKNNAGKMVARTYADYVKDGGEIKDNDIFAISQKEIDDDLYMVYTHESGAFLRKAVA